MNATGGTHEVYRARVITVSDRSARGERPDDSGPQAVARLAAEGYLVDAALVPDGAESVAEAIRAALNSGARLVVTTGGTGISPRDQTPEGTRPLLTRELPGIAEELRRDGARHTPFAVLSRGLAGIAHRGGAAEQGDAPDAVPGALVVNLPGSAAAVGQGLDVLLPLIPHVLAQLDGSDHPAATPG